MGKVESLFFPEWSTQNTVVFKANALSSTFDCCSSWNINTPPRRHGLQPAGLRLIFKLEAWQGEFSWHWGNLFLWSTHCLLECSLAIVFRWQPVSFHVHSESLDCGRRLAVTKILHSSETCTRPLILTSWQLHYFPSCFRGDARLPWVRACITQNSRPRKRIEGEDQHTDNT